MEYQVPQFIEVEDKIFGPLTLKQFIYIAGGIGICAILILSLPLVIGVVLAVPVGIFAGALAFYKINGKAFADVLEAGFSYYVGRRLYLWRKEKQPQTPETAVQTMAAPAPIHKEALSRGKLEALAWQLDVKDTNAPK